MPVNKSFPIKIFTLASLGQFLDFSDSVSCIKQKGKLTPGFIKITYTEYVRGQGSNYTCHHFVRAGEFLELAERLIDRNFAANENTRYGDKVNYAPLIDHMRGGKGASYGHPDWDLCSSSLRVTVDKSTKDPNDWVVSFNIAQSPGEKKGGGIVSPIPGSQEKKFSKFTCALSDLAPNLAAAKAFIYAKMATSPLMAQLHDADAEWRSRQSEPEEDDYQTSE